MISYLYSTFTVYVTVSWDFEKYLIFRTLADHLYGEVPNGLISDFKTI